MRGVSSFRSFLFGIVDKTLRRSEPTSSRWQGTRLLVSLFVAIVVTAPMSSDAGRCRLRGRKRRHRKERHRKDCHKGGWPLALLKRPNLTVSIVRLPRVVLSKPAR